jgi:hypothetical protein
MTPIVDRDAIASNPEWTPSNTEVTLCGPGEALLGTGFIFTEPGNHEVSFLRAAPFLASPETVSRGKSPAIRAALQERRSWRSAWANEVLAQVVFLAIGGVPPSAQHYGEVDVVAPDKSAYDIGLVDRLPDLEGDMADAPFGKQMIDGLRRVFLVRADHPRGPAIDPGGRVGAHLVPRAGVPIWDSALGPEEVGFPRFTSPVAADRRLAISGPVRAADGLSRR